MKEEGRRKKEEGRRKKEEGKSQISNPQAPEFIRGVNPKSKI
ncbi:MAG: hypothetical protein P2A85_00635 [Microcoleus anatoxicus]